MLSYLNVKNYVALFKNKKEQPKPGKGYLLNKDTQQRNYPCNFSIKLYTNFNGSFDPSRAIPCSIIVVYVENKLGRAQTLPSISVQVSFLQNSNLSQKYLL